MLPDNFEMTPECIPKSAKRYPKRYPKSAKMLLCPEAPNSPDSNEDFADFAEKSLPNQLLSNLSLFRKVHFLASVEGRLRSLFLGFSRDKSSRRAHPQRCYE